MKIFFYFMRTYDELPMAEELSREMGIGFGWSAEYPSLDNAELARGYEVVSAPPCSVPAGLLQRFHELGVKCYATHSIGYDHVDLQAAKALGMPVSNVSYPPQGVANYAIMLMLMCLRRMPFIMKCTELQNYTLVNKIGRDLSSCTVGVIGTGSIGGTVLKHLSGFGCRLLCYDLFPREGLPGSYVPLEELYRECDIITLHAPATAQNHHMIDREALAMMKPGVCIVNTARGGLIDTGALIDGLKSGQVGSCALDVLEQESGLYYANRAWDVIDNDEMAILRSFPNVLLSPHTAFYTQTNVRHMLACNFQTAACLRDGTGDPHRVI